MLRTLRRRLWLQLGLAFALLVLLAVGASLNLLWSPPVALAGYTGLVLMAGCTLWLARVRVRWLDQVEARPYLFDEDLYRRFYADAQLPEPVVRTVWNEVATLVHIPPGRLRPDDRLVDITGAPAWYYRLALIATNVAALQMLVEEVVRNGADPPERLETVDDVVRFLATCPRYFQPPAAKPKANA